MEIIAGIQHHPRYDLSNKGPASNFLVVALDVLNQRRSVWGL